MASLPFPQTSDRTPWGVALLSLLPFIFVGPISLIVFFHPGWDPQQAPWVTTGYLAVSSFLTCAGFILGALRKFPRWSYPYAIYLILALTFGAQAPVWIRLLLLAGLAVASFLLPAMRTYFTNLRRDWTLLSYGLYACSLFFLAVPDRDETPVLNVLVLLPSLIIILGALIHLRLASSARRVAVLIGSMLLGALFWAIPILDGMMGSWMGAFIALAMLWIVWGILIGLVLAPMLIVSALARPKPTN